MERQTTLEDSEGLKDSGKCALFLEGETTWCLVPDDILSNRCKCTGGKGAQLTEKLSGESSVGWGHRSMICQEVTGDNRLLK